MYLSLLKFFYNSYPPELSQKKKKKKHIQGDKYHLDDTNY